MAGTHLVEICRDPALVFAAYEALLAEAEKSAAFARILRQAATRAQQTEWPALSSAPAQTAIDKIRGEVEIFRQQVA